MSLYVKGNHIHEASEGTTIGEELPGYLGGNYASGPGERVPELTALQLSSGLPDRQTAMHLATNDHLNAWPPDGTVVHIEPSGNTWIITADKKAWRRSLQALLRSMTRQ